MKARVKATGEIIEIIKIEDNLFIDSHYYQYEPSDIEWEISDNDYWTRLEHQAAIASMQGALANNDLLMQLLKRAKSGSRITHIAVEFANACAHTFVEKLKEK